MTLGYPLFFSLGLLFSAAEGRATSGKDVGVVAQSIEQSGGEFLITEDFHPFAECQISGQECGTSFVTVTEHVKEEFATRTIKRDEAEFVDDKQIHPVKALLQPAKVPFIPGFD